MKWILGLDLRPDGAGAVRTAAWMSATTQGPARQDVIGVHVSTAVPRVELRDDEVDEHVARAEAAAREALLAGGAAEAVARIEVAFGEHPNEPLTVACQYHDADAILIGRHAPGTQDTVIRLGRVARRLIRGLPAAVMVVPPDFEPQEAVGPIIVATDLSDDSIAAAVFGNKLARELGRELMLLHVRRGSEYAPGTVEAGDEHAVRRWSSAYDLDGARTLIERGDPVNRMLSLARREHASVLVCGSRQLSMMQRFFQASTATDLARFATRPVVVVPPTSLLRTSA